MHEGQQKATIWMINGMHPLNLSSILLQKGGGGDGSKYTLRQSYDKVG